MILNLSQAEKHEEYLTLPYLCRKLCFRFLHLSCLLELNVTYKNTTKEEEADGYVLGPGILDLKIATLFNFE